MAKNMMNAVAYDRFVNGVLSLKHVRVPIPKPGRDEVVIRVEAASLNPVDRKAYRLKALWSLLFATNSPLIPATDVAGEVVEAGAGVKKFVPGDKVVAHLNFFRGGGLSEYGVAKEALTVLRPPNVAAVEASGLPIAGETAYKSLTQSAGLKLNDSEHPKNVLITAASGGVGHYAVQLAKFGKHHVTATCGGRNVDLVKSVGADEVLDYKTPQGASLKSPSGKKYDVVIHCATAVPWSVFDAVVSDDGVVVDLTPGPATMVRFVVKKLAFAKKKLVPYIRVPKDDQDLKILVKLMEEGKLKTVVESKHALSNAEEAWRKGIGGHVTGKVVIEP